MRLSESPPHLARGEARHPADHQEFEEFYRAEVDGAMRLDVGPTSRGEAHDIVHDAFVGRKDPCIESRGWRVIGEHEAERFHGGAGSR